MSYEDDYIARREGEILYKADTNAISSFLSTKIHRRYSHRNSLASLFHSAFKMLSNSTLVLSDLFGSALAFLHSEPTNLQIEAGCGQLNVFYTCVSRQILWTSISRLTRVNQWVYRLSSLRCRPELLSRRGRQGFTTRRCRSCKGRLQCPR